MKVLLDTHTLIWWLSDDPRLGPRARATIADPTTDVFVSMASLWEIVVKLRVGKLHADIHEIIRATETQGFTFLPITQTHLIELARLPAHHRDPFDHLLIAQAIAEGLTFISDDTHTPSYAVTHLWCSASGGTGKKAPAQNMA